MRGERIALHVAILDWDERISGLAPSGQYDHVLSCFLQHRREPRVRLGFNLQSPQGSPGARIQSHTPFSLGGITQGICNSFIAWSMRATLDWADTRVKVIASPTSSPSRGKGWSHPRRIPDDGHGAD